MLYCIFVSFRDEIKVIIIIITCSLLFRIKQPVVYGKKNNSSSRF